MVPIIDRDFLPNRLGKARKRSSKVPVFAMVLVAVLMLGVIAVLMVQLENNSGQHLSETPVRIPAGILYTTHSPISINGNAGFTALIGISGVSGGTGTASDPYIIEGWDINASTATGILIGNTSAFFIIRNCYVHGGGGSYYGIYLSDCVNGFLSNNNCSNNSCGIFLMQASSNIQSTKNNNTFSNNNCSSNHNDGIRLDLSSYNILINNNCSNNIEGIDLASSNYTAISNNTCCSNNYYGIDLNSPYPASPSSNNMLSNNTCLHNGAGISLYQNSNSNTISDNNCSSNKWYGIYGYSSNYDILDNNTCLHNPDGIYLYSSSHDTLKSNTCSHNSEGIYLYSSSNNNIIGNNNCSSSTSWGIELDGSSYNSLSNNTCSHNLDGIYLYLSDHNALSKNTCSHNTNDGMYIYASNYDTSNNNTCRYDNPGIMVSLGAYNEFLGNDASNNLLGIDLAQCLGDTVRDNTVSNNTQYGMRLKPSDSLNKISNNIVLNNGGYGIYIFDAGSNNNTIWNNTIYHNNGAGDTYNPTHIQAFDSGKNNRWNSSGTPHGYGNNWSDWRAPDNNWDGIVDIPYNISGSAGAKDYYPLTTPGTSIPEFGMMPLVVIALVAVIVLTGETRRRKKS